MPIQRFRNPIHCCSLMPRVISFVYISLRHSHGIQDYRSVIVESLKSKFDARHFKIEDSRKFKISIHDPIFRGMPLDDQHKLVIDLLPEHIRNDVVVESSDIAEKDIDRTVRKVCVKNNVIIPPAGNIHATPQSFLDLAVYQLSKQSGAMASESLWLCGSSALKNFCISNGFLPKQDTSKKYVVSYLKESVNEFRSQLDSSWITLNYCCQNAYHDHLSLGEVHEYLESAELFCNTLFDIHHSKQFKCDEFKKYLPKSMTKENNIYIDFH